MTNRRPIKFSHRYIKLPFNIKTANLLGVQRRSIQDRDVNPKIQQVFRE